MAIYTKTGDKGETSLANGERVSKTDARIEAYGTVDELNSWIGSVRASIEDVSMKNELEWIQHRLFNLGALLSSAPGEWIVVEDVQELERWIDARQQQIPRQHSFILPTGEDEVCRCHICRTVCRRAERRMIEAGINGIPVAFVNRLSDYLFVLARHIAHLRKQEDVAWKKAFKVEKVTE